MTCKIKKHLDSLFSLQRRGIKLGLEHTERLLKFYKDPHKKISTIHVAGTNGKGSTCAYIERILRENGYKVGLYTSPHLLKFNERIRIDGFPISDEEIVQFLDNSFDEINKIKSTFFEATTVMAFDYFYKKKVDIAVIETGLGGRLDATNVICPKISVITSISEDHTDILGESIEEIAMEKAGIIKEKTPVIVYKQDRKILNILQKKSTSLNASMTISEYPTKINYNSSSTKFIYNNNEYHIPLIGFHQARNASLAIDVVNALYPNVKNRTIKKALKKVFWPGRMHRIEHNIFYDVSHNKNGLEKTLETLKTLYSQKDLHGLLLLKKGKNIESLKGLISKSFKSLIIPDNENDLLFNSNILAEELSGLNIQCKTVSSLKKGSEIIKKLVNKDKSIGLIFGSHYVAHDIFNAFEISFDNYYI